MIVGLHLVALPAGLEIVLLVSRDSPCPLSPTTPSPRLSSLSLRPSTPRHSISCTLDSAYPSLVHLHDLASLLLRNALPLPVTSPVLPSSSSSSHLPWHSSSAQAPYLFRVVPPSLCLLLTSRPYRSHSLSLTFISLRSRVAPSCWTSSGMRCRLFVSLARFPFWVVWRMRSCPTTFRNPILHARRLVFVRHGFFFLATPL
jgi:hypothetical protein